ncbi:MAG: hypothetical protein HQL93_09005 [Magnetococcales bacterium]|nr:hypothetical protein [Magnetococcales bacterium]
MPEEKTDTARLVRSVAKESLKEKQGEVVMAKLALKKQRSQARAAKKRARSKPRGRRPASMTPEEFRRISTQTASAVAKELDVPEDEVAEVMEIMAEEGFIGLDAKGHLAMRKAIPSS